MKIIFCDIILTSNHLKKIFLKMLNLFEKWVFLYRRHLNTKIYSIFIYKYVIFFFFFVKLLSIYLRI